MKEYWPYTYHKFKHLVEHSQTSTIRKLMLRHILFIRMMLSTIILDVTYLDVADFFESLEETIDHLIGNGSIYNKNYF